MKLIRSPLPRAGALSAAFGRALLPAIAATGLAVTAGLVVAQAAAAQDRLVETVVTAARVQTPVQQTAGAVTVITADDIDAAGQRTIVEALREVPGLNIVQNGGAGTITSVFMRGANSNQTLVLINGIEVSDPSSNGAFNFANLLTGNIERIEVVRGPLSTLYGSDAIGGVINVITRRPTGGTAVSARAEGGSFGTFNEAAGFTAGLGRTDLAAHIEYFDTEGISITPARLRPAASGEEEDGYQNLTGSLEITARTTEDLSLTAYVQRIESRLDTDVRAEDPNSSSVEDQLFAKLEARLSALGGDLTHSLAADYSAQDRFDYDPPDALSGSASTAISEGGKRKLRYQGTFFGFESHVLTWGAETEREIIDTQSTFSSGFASNTDEATRTNAAFIQNQAAFGDSVFVSGAIRVDDSDRFGSQTTYRVAPVVLMQATGTKLSASLGTGFKAPTLFQLFGASSFLGFITFTGNPNLRPEESRSWEIGIEQAVLGGRALAGATYFNTVVDNLIVSTANFTTVENRNEANLWGLEAFLAADLGANADLRVDYTFIRAEDGVTGRDLLRRPKHKASARLSTTPWEDVRLGVAATYIGRRLDVDAVSFANKRTGAFTTVDAHGSYDVTPAVRAFARITNLFGERYEEPDGFNQPGRAAFIGLSARF